MDALPVISQLKSLYQAVRLDPEGARITQKNFSKQCPIISQSRSFVEAVILGDPDAAKDTQLEFVGFVSAAADATPVIGHVKGIIHYSCGDNDGGDRAMKASSRTTGVIGGGVSGFLVGGPVGAAAGGVGGGLAMDGLTTGIESAVKNKYKPSGSIEIVTRMANGESRPGDEFDLIAGTAMDAYIGNRAGCIFGAKAGSLMEQIRTGEITFQSVAQDILSFLKKVNFTELEVQQILAAVQKIFESVEMDCLPENLKGCINEHLKRSTRTSTGRQKPRKATGEQAERIFAACLQVINTSQPGAFLPEDLLKRINQTMVA